MIKRLLAILVVVGILVGLIIPIASRVMAIPIFSVLDVGIAPGEPLHPNNVYLRGMTIHYKPMMIGNWHTGENLPWTMNITDTTPDGVIHPLATNVVLNNGESWNYTNAGTNDFFNYTLTTTGTELADVASPPFPTSHSVQSIVDFVGYAPYPDQANDVASKTSYVATPSIKVTKTPDKTLVKPGDTITYNLTVTNDGDWNMTMQTVSDDLVNIPPGSFGNLAVGASQSAFVSYQVKDTDPSTLTNHFTATYNATGFDPTIPGAVVSDANTSSVTLVHPYYTLDKTANPTSGPSGTSITYTVYITNSGDVQLDWNFSDDSLIGPIAGFPTTMPAHTGPYTITYTRPIAATDTSPIDNKITTIYQVHGLTDQLTKEATARVTITEIPPPPPPTPASSNLTIWLTISSFAGLMAFFILRKGRFIGNPRR